MFTGIVQHQGRLSGIGGTAGDRRLRIGAAPQWLRSVSSGDSIAVNGVCLTVVDPQADSFGADVSAETLGCTTLGGLSEGAVLNLERAVIAGQALDGHLVSGHVDAVTEVLEVRPDGRSVRITLGLPGDLAGFVAPKGSICVDGVSLTVNEVDPAWFGVNIVPHTQAVTIAGGYRSGTQVNLEIDIIARYVARLLAVPPASGR